MIVNTYPIQARDGAGSLTVYLLDDQHLASPAPRPMVVVVPGGAYGGLAPTESEPVAVQMLARGFYACVIRYDVRPAVFQTALEELALAVAFLRDNAAQFNIDPRRIIVAGFSAGGHLTASLGTLWHHAFLSELCGMENERFRPTGLVLSYPVITSGKYAHQGSILNLLGDRYGDPELMELVSLEKQVTPNMPPTFLWHTFEDEAVFVENTLMLAAAMRRENVKFELHIFPDGPHGFSLANAEVAGDNQAMISPVAAQWFGLAADWIRRLQ